MTRTSGALSRAVELVAVVGALPTVAPLWGDGGDGRDTHGRAADTHLSGS